MAKPHPDVLAALTLGIQAEVAAYVFYLEAAKKVRKQDLIEPLKRLANEEKKHFHILERQYDSLIRSEKWITTADVMKQEGLPEINEDMTNEHKDLVKKVGNMKSDREVLDMALSLEEKARDTYKAAHDKADSDGARETFHHLTNFEQGHVNLINSMIADLD